MYPFITVLVLFALLAPAAHADPPTLLGVGSQVQPQPEAPAARFHALVRSGHESFSKFLSRHELDHADKDLRRALEAYRAALALRDRERLTRADAGKDLRAPDLALALIHFYLGNHGAALANLEGPLAQGVPAGADVLTADAIRAQVRKAQDLKRRLESPFLPLYEPIAQRTGSSCAPTSVHEQLTGMGLRASLARAESLRERGSGAMAEVVGDALSIAREAGAEMDAATADAPRTADREVAFPSGVSIEGLRDVLARGYPVVAAVKSYQKPDAGYLAWTNGHYLLLVGAKCGADGQVASVYAADPDGGVWRRFTRAEFQAIWDANARGAFVLVPRAPHRRFRCRVSVRHMFAPEAARGWVGAAQQSAD